MADDRNENRKRDMNEVQQGGSHQSPGRNPQDDKSAGGQKGQDSDRQDRQGNDGGGYKEGGQNEQTRR